MKKLFLFCVVLVSTFYSKEALAQYMLTNSVEQYEFSTYKKNIDHLKFRKTERLDCFNLKQYPLLYKTLKFGLQTSVDAILCNTFNYQIDQQPFNLTAYSWQSDFQLQQIKNADLINNQNSFFYLKK